MGVVLAAALLTVVTSTRDVRSLAFTPSGRLVAATSGGVLLVGPEGERLLSAGASRAVLADGARVVAATADGVFAFDEDGTARGRLAAASVFALTRWRGELVAGAPAGFDRGLVVALAASGDHLLVGTLGKGLYLWPSGAHAKGSDPLVWSIAAGPGGTAWVGTSRGLVRVDRRGRLSGTELASLDVRALAVDGDRVVAGSWGEGAFVSEGSGWRPLGPPHAKVQAVAIRGDRVALGTPDGGVVIDLGSGASTVFARAGLAANDLSAVAPAPDGGAWVGTFDRGLVRVDAAGRVTGGWRESDGLLDDRINALAPGVLGGVPGVFIATERGLGFRGDAGGLRAIPPFGHHLSTVAVVAGRLWAGAADGLYVLGHDRLERVDGFPLRRVTAIAPLAAADGHPRFVGGAAGLVIHGGDGAELVVDSLSGLPEDWVTALAPAGGDAVFAGTYRHGVVRVDGAGRVAVVSTERWINPGALVADRVVVFAGTLGDGLLVGPAVADDGAWAPMAGLPDRQITGLARSGGALWIATRSGLARWALE